MGARPSYRPGRGGRGHPAEPGHPSRTILALPHDRAPSNLHQVQPVPLTQCAAWGLRSQKHTTYAHAGILRLLLLPAVHPDGSVCKRAKTKQTDILLLLLLLILILIIILPLPVLLLLLLFLFKLLSLLIFHLWSHLKASILIRGLLDFDILTVTKRGKEIVLKIINPHFLSV